MIINNNYVFFRKVKFYWEKFGTKGGNTHTKMIIPELNKFIMNECMKQKRKKLTKTMIKRISGKSQKVIDRFYEYNKDEINKYNSLIL
jgi:hypothetical protein